MAEYHFVSIWQITAPIERVWEEIYHAERWPSWWKDVARVDELEPGGADGVGRHARLHFRTRLPYTLAFDARLTCVQPPSKLVAEATGELRGTGCWTLTSVDDGTLVRYTWDVRTTRWWMNLLAPAARPAFKWNHDQLMREGGESLARRLGADLVVPVTQGTPAGHITQVEARRLTETPRARSGSRSFFRTMGGASSRGHASGHGRTSR